MGGLGLQDALVALAALGAAGWLVARWWRHRRRPAGCDCEGCPVAEGRPLPRAAGGAAPGPPPGTAFIPASELTRRR
jgi:hypothetical protein